MTQKKPAPPHNADDIPLTDKEWLQMRPASEIVPDVVAAHSRGELQKNPARVFRGAPVET